MLKFIIKVKYFFIELFDGTHWYNIKYGIRNLYRYFSIIWNHRDYDSTHILKIFKFNLELLRKKMREDSYEVEEDLSLKLKDIDRVIEILDNIINDKHYETSAFIYKGLDFEELADGNFLMKNNLTKDEEEYNTSVTKGIIKIEQEEWDELFLILKEGKNYPNIKAMQSWWC
jgi:hypothetical protein